MRKYRFLVMAAVGIAALYVFNASWRVPPEASGLRLISHRGVHQTFHRQGLKNDTCTARNIEPPVHDYVENTVRSMHAAFAAGADIVELDVHPTVDGLFAVMHDWTLDCRTEGAGETRSHDMAYLKTLDVGFGYTADGGRTFPLRGSGVGLMPELKEVFSSFPSGRFLVDFKSREKREGDMLASLLTGHPGWKEAVWGVYGGDEPAFRAKELIGDGLKAFSRRSITDCLGRYAMLGWTGYMPDACKDTIVAIPLNAAPWLWGWPNLLVRRLHAAGSELILLGPFRSGDSGVTGIDTLDQLARVPPGFSGYLWTDRIDIIGPAVKR